MFFFVKLRYLRHDIDSAYQDHLPVFFGPKPLMLLYLGIVKKTNLLLGPLFVGTKGRSTDLVVLYIERILCPCLCTLQYIRQVGGRYTWRGSAKSCIPFEDEPNIQKFSKIYKN